MCQKLKIVYSPKEFENMSARQIAAYLVALVYKADYCADTYELPNYPLCVEHSFALLN